MKHGLSCLSFLVYFKFLVFCLFVFFLCLLPSGVINDNNKRPGPIFSLTAAILKITMTS